MNSFKILIILSLALTQILLQGCGRKGALYSPETNMGNTQSDQAFIFPPTRKNSETSTNTPQQKETK